MDILDKATLKKAILKAFQEYIEFLGDDPESEIQLVIDEVRDHLIIRVIRLSIK